MGKAASLARQFSLALRPRPLPERVLEAFSIEFFLKKSSKKALCENNFTVFVEWATFGPSFLLF